MRNSLLFILFMAVVTGCNAQEGYPVPPHTNGRLFYIQHANNHNTFVYDANLLSGKKVSDAEPIKVHRINYKKGGIKEELSGLQRKMAYGVECIKTAANTFDFTLAAYPAKKFTLKVGGEASPHVTVFINGKNIILNRMFLFCNKLGTGVSSINFYGKDALTGKEITENFVVKK
ncbi:DUF4833 domain-containing protein [Flavobacterium sp. DG1-102-2]|uniref:DUF4833 domain-containing protein n=1 Tax=Flavobacterium sp. DG1-102-2 TaxID=3081663 RepID=UPI00294A98CD|nr:DUF4833 domain-containing protein [Flavobacterium sp. DG1-102-2]MDV6168435.1 DUF4833 domain-containing protein [Flavobacterium sp. DG1-102-2]